MKGLVATLLAALTSPIAAWWLAIAAAGLIFIPALGATLFRFTL